MCPHVHCAISAFSAQKHTATHALKMTVYKVPHLNFTFYRERLRTERSLSKRARRRPLRVGQTEENLIRIDTPDILRQWSRAAALCPALSQRWREKKAAAAAG